MSFSVPVFVPNNLVPTTNTILPPPVLSLHHMKPRKNIAKFTDSSYCVKNLYRPHNDLLGLFVTLPYWGYQINYKE
jgi:hypothetical protein